MSTPPARWDPDELRDQVEQQIAAGGGTNGARLIALALLALVGEVARVRRALEKGRR